MKKTKYPINREFFPYSKFTPTLNRTVISLSKKFLKVPKFLWKDPEATTFLEKSKQWGTVDWYLFPDFSETKAEYNKAFEDEEEQKEEDFNSDEEQEESEEDKEDVRGQETKNNRSMSTVDVPKKGKDKK